MRGQPFRAGLGYGHRMCSAAEQSLIALLMAARHRDGETAAAIWGETTTDDPDE